MLLNDFPDRIRQVLIRLPYRVGYYISISDQTGGKESEETEIKALENLLSYYHEDTLKSEFSQEILSRTLEEKPNWPAWNKDVKKIHNECRNLFKYLDTIVEEKDILAFKRNLLEIGVTVAMAHAESGGEPENITTLDKIQAGINRAIKEFKTLFRQEKNHLVKTHANISQAERAALLRLANTLGVSYN